MASSSALVPLPIELKPNPLPYGRLPLQAGAWDQLQARRAYDIEEPHGTPPAALDRRI